MEQQLPMSFMATFFAINIAEFPKDSGGGVHLGYVSKYMCRESRHSLLCCKPAHSLAVSITAAVAVPFIVLALKVNEMGSLFKGSESNKDKKYEGYPGTLHTGSLVLSELKTWVGIKKGKSGDLEKGD
jgi:hypothetical protein